MFDTFRSSSLLPREVRHFRPLLLVSVVLLASTLPTFAQWEQPGGPFGGIVNRFHIQGNAILAGTEGGIFRSTDDGVHWQRSGSLTIAERTRSFLSYGSRLYAATYIGLQLSDDGGISWSAIADSGLPTDVYDITRQQDTLYAATNSGLLRSEDGGLHWNQLKRDSLEVPWFLSIIATDSTIIAGSDRGLYRSTDGGRRWNKVTPFSLRYVYQIIIHDGSFYAATSAGVLRSKDDGRTWEDLGGTDISSIAFAPDGTLYRASIYQNDLYRSSDTGATWKRIDSGLATRTFTAVIATGSSVLISRYQAGVLRSLNQGTSWKNASEGLSAVHAYRLATNASALYVATLNNGLQKSTDIGETWSVVLSNTKDPQITTVATMGDTVFAGSAVDREGYLYRSTNNAKSWQQIDHISGDYGGVALFVDGKDLYMSYNRHVSRSIDIGASWQQADSGLPDAYVYDMTGNGHSIFAVTITAWKNRDGGVFRSNDEGKSWKLLNTGLTTYNDCYNVATLGDTVIVASSRGILRSTDNGESWGKPQKVESKSVRRIGSTFYANSFRGVIRSADAGTTWENFNEGLPQRGGGYFVGIGGFVIASIESTGVARRRMGDIPVSVPITTRELELLKVYPNPANGDEIHIDLPQRTNDGELQLSTLLGDVIRSLTMERGATSMTLDLQGIPSGVYMVRVRDGERVIGTSVVVR